MDWKELTETVYYWDGSWRDIYVSETTKDDWAKWIEYVNANFRIEWYNGKTDRDETKIDYSIISEYWNGNFDLRSTAKIFVDKLQINAHFFDSDEFENDIDPREFTSIDDHHKLMKYMNDLSKLFKKTILLTPENVHEIMLLKVEGDTITFDNNINPRQWEARIRK